MIHAKLRSEAELLADKYMQEHPDEKEVEYEFDIDDVKDKND